MVKVLLSKLLGERKITQAQLAKATGIRAATINDLFHGNAHSISFENLDLICAELDCSICDILVRNNQVDYLIERGKVEVLSELLSVAVANAEKAVNEAQIKIDALTKQLDDAKSTYTPFTLPDFKQMNEYESFVKRIEKATGKGMRLSVLCTLARKARRNMLTYEHSDNLPEYRYYSGTYDAYCFIAQYLLGIDIETFERMTYTPKSKNKRLLPSN